MAHVKKRLVASLCVCLSAAFVGCAALYPRFDNPLNPDIALLNAGDVVDSVKCAVTAFILERASKLRGSANKFLHDEFNKHGGRHIERNFCPVGKNWVDPPDEWRIALLSPVPDENGRNVCKEVKFIEPKKVMAGGGEIEPWEGLKSCSPPYRPYRFITLVKSEKKGFEFKCLPNGGCEPGYYPTRSGNCAMDDNSRLALDPNGVAKIELNLTAVNTGSMNYNRIDADRLDLRSIIVPGGGVNPFPSFKATDKNTNKVGLTVLMSQNSLKPEKLDKYTRDTIKIIEEMRKDTRTAAAESLRSRDNLREADLTQEYFTQKAYTELLEEHQEFKSQCGLLKVDFLALKRYITRIVDEQDQRIHKGVPNISLENFVLTSEFQISLDASAGTKNILRILPVLAAPTLGLVSDHTHSLKITFNGAKSRALITNTFSLKQKCIERVTGAGVNLTQDPEVFCSSPQAIQLESLIDAVESKGGT